MGEKREWTEAARRVITAWQLLRFGKGCFMVNIGLILFGVYLLVMIILDIGMLVSLIRPGDERRQMIVWKASTWTLVATMGSLFVGIIEGIVKVQEMSINPFSTLTATATIYFVCLLYYKRKYGD